MLGIALVAAVITTAVAVLIRWLPSSASEEMDRITFTYWFATIICIAIFSLVIGVIVYSVLAFRVQPDDDTDGPPIHGNTRLEVIWTVVPAILVIAIGIVSAVVLEKNADAGANPLRVKVFAQQFAWRFEYPGNVRSDELVLPLHRHVKFEMTSVDVIHSFWIPQMGQKQDVVPGIETEIVVTPTRTGTFTLICTELCGLGHAVMRTQAIVMTQTAFDKWIQSQTKATASPNPSVSGAAVFKNNPCGSCHTLAAAGTTAKVGPDLDKLPQYAQTAGKPLADFISESITDPNAYTEKGYPKNVMPPFNLPQAQLDALVQYLIQSSKKG